MLASVQFVKSVKSIKSGSDLFLEDLDLIYSLCAGISFFNLSELCKIMFEYIDAK